MPWVQFLPLLLVVVLLFIARLRRVELPRVVRARLALANGFLAGALALALRLVFLQGPDNIRGFGILTSLLTGVGYFFLVLAFLALAQYPPPHEALFPEARPVPPERAEGITIREGS